MMKSVIAFLAVFTVASIANALGTEEMIAVLRTIDQRTGNNVGDYKALVYIEQKEKGKDDLLYESVVYRRDADDKLMIVFARPKAEAGKGYLRLDKNLFYYDPTVGKWERRTERERIAGTNTRRQDFDEMRLAEEFSPTFVGEEKLGAFTVYHLELHAKPGFDVAYPVVHVWVDKDSGNLLKQQQYALSGKLMRTAYLPKWGKLKNPKTSNEVYYALEQRVFDEVDKGTDTTIVVRQVDLQDLPDNMFTKAWLESQSR
ncbi:MAG: outer membrane lipoprotein-sorting protein [Clostridia bacterium]|nr:outer membrane lipoprotein-sorting protein [Deltaproteobacteria bacterium]